MKIIIKPILSLLALSTLLVINTVNSQQPIIRKTFFFVRHGTTQHNLDQVCQGQLDTPLHPKGIIEAQNVSLENTGITDVFYSPLARAAETAKIITTSLGCHKIALPELKGWNCGDLQGQKMDPCNEDLAKIYRTVAPVNGETWIELLNRVIDGINFGLENSAIPLFVAHHSVFRAIVHALGLEYKKSGNCELIKFVPNAHDDGWTIIR